MSELIAHPLLVRNEKNADGPAKDCTEYNRDCACWRCLRHFHLQVADHQFKMLRKYGKRSKRFVSRSKGATASLLSHPRRVA